MSVLNAKTRQPGEKIIDEKGNEQLVAVMYGKGLPNQHLVISPQDFLRLFKEVQYSMLFDMKVDDQAPVKALIQEVQVDPVKMHPIHVDFRQIRMDQPITVTIPFEFAGESGAVKMGGTLVKSIDEADVECLPANLPKSLPVDLSLLATYEDRITVGSIAVPEGVKILKDVDEVIATVEEPLSEEELKKLEEQEVGDVTDVKSEQDEKKEAEVAEGEAKSEEGK